MPGFIAVKTPADAAVQHRASSVVPELGDFDVWLESSPRVRVAIVRRKFVLQVLGACVVISVFTCIAYRGIRIQGFRCSPKDTVMIRDMSDKVELSNAISGFLMALLEAALGVYMQNFLAVFKVYLHNWIETKHRSSASKAVTIARESALFVLPVVFILIVGQSLRSFQATLVSRGFEWHMVENELVRDAYVAVTHPDERSAKSPEDSQNQDPSSDGGIEIEPNILARAVNGTSYPFEMLTNSTCSAPSISSMISIRDLDSASAVFGFPPRGLYNEMMHLKLVMHWSHRTNYTQSRTGERQTSPSDFDWGLAASMFGAGKVQLDRLVAESISSYVRCPAIDTEDRFSQARQWCATANQTLVEVAKYKMSEERTKEKLYGLISNSLGGLLPGVSSNLTTIDIASYNITPDISMETLIVSAGQPLPSQLGINTSQYCGADDCVFLHHDSNVDISPQVVLVPYEDCTYKDIDYLYDFRVFSPTNCKRHDNSVLVIALSTYITAASYGSTFEFDFPNATIDGQHAVGPYLLSPERRIDLVISRLTWQYTDLNKVFNATCLHTSCKGLVYPLRGSGHYAFVGVDALPLEDIREATLANPIPLLQFNPARFFNRSSGLFVRAEPLRWGDPFSFGSRNWTQKLSPRCSSLMDSFIKHMVRNNLGIRRPFRIAHMSTLFYLFSKGGVVDSNRRDAGLKGSKELSQIIVRVPMGTLTATHVCCCALIVVAVLIVVFPSRTVEYFSPEVTAAEQFLKIQSCKYPCSLHKKTLSFPASGEALPMEDFEVISVTLANREDPTETVRV